MTSKKNFKDYKPHLEPPMEVPPASEGAEELFPTDTAVLKNDLQAFGARAPARVAAYLAQGNLEDAYWLDQGLSDMNVDVNIKRPFIKYWLNKKGSAIPEELEARLAPERKKERDQERRKDEIKQRGIQGDVWTVTPEAKIRMAQEGEIGISLDEAKRAVKEITKATVADEPMVVYNEELGRHMPNFRSQFVMSNLPVAWATARTMDKAAAEGEPVDPLDAFIEIQTKAQMAKEILGVKEEKPAPKEERPATLTDMVTALRELKSMADEGKKGELPPWMTDPLEFNRMIRELTPGESEESRALREELKAMAKTIDEMREQRLRDEISSYKAEVARLGEKVGDLTQELRDSRHAVGSTSIDLLRDIAGKVSDKLPDKRDIREVFSEAMGKRPVLRRRGPAERERELESMAGSLGSEVELRDIEDFWLFRER